MIVSKKFSDRLSIKLITLYIDIINAQKIDKKITYFVIIDENKSIVYTKSS